jgi:hypothetical protein
VARSPRTRYKEQKEAIRKVDLSDIIPRNPDTGHVPPKYWNKRSNRVRALRAFVERCGLPLHELRIIHFVANGLSPLLYRYPRPRLEMALKEAGYEQTEEMRLRKMAAYCTPGKRRRLAEDLAKRLGKKVYELTTYDTKDASLTSLLTYSGGIGGLMRDCGYDPDKFRKPRGYWVIRANRKKTVEGVLRATGKRPEELTEQDLTAHMAGMLLVLYKKVPRNKRLKIILSDVGLSDEPLEPDEWGLVPRGIPGRWEDVTKKDRVRVLQRIAEKLGMDLEDLGTKDIARLGLMGLVLKGPDASGSVPVLLEWAKVDQRRARKERRKERSKRTN